MHRINSTGLFCSFLLFAQIESRISTPMFSPEPEEERSPEDEEDSPPGRSALLVAVALPVAGLWCLMTWSAHWHEYLAGLAVVGLSCLFLRPVFAAELRHHAFTFSDVCACWPLPWYVLRSTWEITVVLFQDVFGDGRAPSLWRVSGFHTARREPRIFTRRALAVAYTSVAPNCIVVGIDYKQNRMLFHQIRRGPVPAMTQRLGAQVARHPRRSFDTEPKR